MKLSRTFLVLLCLLLVIMQIASARRGGRKRDKKNKKKALQWKNSSVAKNNKWFIAVEEHEPLVINCKAIGRPKPTYKWFKNHKKISRSNDHIQLKKHTLRIANASMSDAGNYSCIVENEYGSLDFDIILEVQKRVWPLEIMGPIPVNKTASVGATVTFRCWVTNDDSATIQWKKVDVNGKGIMVEEGAMDLASDLSDPGLLRLSNVQKSDEGFYACVGYNSDGHRDSLAHLTVIEPRVPPTELTGYNTGADIGGRNSWGSDKYNYGDTFGENDPLVEHRVEAGSLPFDPDFGPEVLTTRRPRNRNKGKKKDRKNKNRKKNRKGKGKKNKTTVSNSYFTTRKPSTRRSTTRSTASTTTTTTTTTMSTTQKITRRYNIDYGTVNKKDDNSQSNKDNKKRPAIWSFGAGDDGGGDGVSDTRYSSGLDPTVDGRAVGVDRGTGTPTRGGDSAAAEGNEIGGDIKKGETSTWTIYTAVGAVCGVVLLIGLIAVTLTLCCKREDEGVYKAPASV